MYAISVFALDGRCPKFRTNKIRHFFEPPSKSNSTRTRSVPINSDGYSEYRSIFSAPKKSHWNPELNMLQLKRLHAASWSANALS
jgi:hypothetical protein